MGQRTVCRYVAVLHAQTMALGGMVKEFSCDKKGFVFKAVFGLFGASAGGEVEAQGTLCAMRALDRLKWRGFRASAGVASGVAFCGPVHGGSGQFVAFTMLGTEAVTLAARLTSAAETGHTLCSPSVYAKTNGHYVLYDGTSSSVGPSVTAGVQLERGSDARLFNRRLRPESERVSIDVDDIDVSSSAC
jgi:class 3 adenylate cyclase